MLLQKLGKAPNTTYDNIEPTEVMRKGASYVGMIRDLLNKPKLTTPSRPLPTSKSDLADVQAHQPSVVWFGHSSYLITYQGYTVLVDPILFGPASPLSFYGKPFKGTSIYNPDEIPAIDLLVITHDHYDHLSYETVMALKGKVKKIVVPMGVSSHFTYWGFDKEQIVELNRNESAAISDTVSMTAVSARHFSGRFLSRNKTLWVSYVLNLHGCKIFIGGDSGYSAQFKATGDTYGPFDIAFLECGQYGKDWPNIHMMPEETAQAAIDLQARVVLPVHWAKFTLAMHQWNEPIKRLLKAASGHTYTIALPMIGELYVIGSDTKDKEWWNFE